MKQKLLILALMLLAIVTGTQAQKKFNLYAVGFYNQENLFDTCHDEGKRDYDFLPGGSYKWNGLKYSHKLRNMAQALRENQSVKTITRPARSKRYVGVCVGLESPSIMKISAATPEALQV